MLCDDLEYALSVSKVVLVLNLVLVLQSKVPHCKIRLWHDFSGKSRNLSLAECALFHFREIKLP